MDSAITTEPTTKWPTVPRETALPLIQSLLQDLIRDSRHRFKAIARDLGLTFYQASVLLTIRRLQGPASMSDLSDGLQLPASTITSVIDALIKRNLVIRERHSSDRRAVLAILTPAGRTLADRLARRGFEIFAARFDAMDDVYLAALLAGLRHLVPDPSQPG